jgi:hypothetical protein
MPPAPRLPSATGTTRARGLGFSSDETKALLRSIEKYLPIGGLEWDTVVSEHEGLFPVEQRTKEALKRKFAALHNKRIPTGDPHIPESVRYAKRLIEEIKNKADISDGEDYDEEVPSYVPDSSAHIIGKTNFSVPFTIRVRFVTNTNDESDARVDAPLIVQATVVEQFLDNLCIQDDLRQHSHFSFCISHLANHFRITPYVNRKINRDTHSKLYVLRYTCKMRNVYSGSLHYRSVVALPLLWKYRIRTSDHPSSERITSHCYGRWS